MIEEPGTLTDEQRALSWFRMVYLLDGALGRTPEEFGYMQDDLQTAWYDAMNRASQEVAACSDEPRRVDDMAKAANASFQASITPLVIVPWEDILPEYRLKWQFLIRHTANLFEWTTDEDEVEQIEMQLLDLFKEELAKIPRESP